MTTIPTLNNFWSAANSSPSSGNMTLTADPTSTAGKLLVVIAVANNTSANITTTTTGWGSSVGVQGNSTNHQAISLFYKKAAGGSETITIHTTGTQFAAEMHVIDNAADPGTTPPVLSFANHGVNSNSINFSTTNQTTLPASMGLLDLFVFQVDTSGKGISPTQTFTDPTTQFNNQALHVTNMQGGSLGGLEGYYGTGSGIGEGTGFWSSAPVHVALSGTTLFNWLYAMWAIGGSPNILSAGGTMGKITGAATVAQKSGVTVAGAMKKMTASADVSIHFAVAVAASMGNISGAADVFFYNYHPVISGTLGEMTAEIEGIPGTTVTVDVAMGGMSSDIELLPGSAATIDGAMGSMSADFDIFVGPKFEGDMVMLGFDAIDVEVTVFDGVAVDATMGGMSSDVEGIVGPIVSLDASMQIMSSDINVKVFDAVAISSTMSPVTIDGNFKSHIRDANVYTTDELRIIVVAATDRTINVPATDYTILAPGG